MTPLYCLLALVLMQRMTLRSLICQMMRISKRHQILAMKMVQNVLQAFPTCLCGLADITEQQGNSWEVIRGKNVVAGVTQVSLTQKGNWVYR